MSTGETRRFCIKIDPSCESTLLLALSHRGKITADKGGTVLWAELPAGTECELERLAGVLTVIKYVQPLWGDVLRQ
jgi:hypothetical protein